MDARIVVVWLVLACAHEAAADAVDWEAGQQAFEQGDFVAALARFEAVRDEDATRPSVHYNIAVCHFKLGNFTESSEAFIYLARRFPKMRGLAEYNQGLIARRQGDDAAAMRHFLRAYELSPENETLRILASNELGELAVPEEPASRWGGAVSIGAGYDDNIALRAETGLPGGVSEDSALAEVYASLGGPLRPGSRVRMEGDVYGVRYFDAGSFDQTEIRVAGSYGTLLGAWEMRAGGHAVAGSLGGASFDRKIGATVMLTRTVNAHSTLQLAYVFDSVDEMDSSYAGIAGTRQQSRLRYRWREIPHEIRVQLGHEANDRQDPGVSPDRFGTAVEYRYRRNGGWGYEAGLRYRSSDYAGATVRRTEDLRAIDAAVSRQLPGNWLLFFRYAYSDNDSTDPMYSYERSQFQVTAMWTF
jgi:hypothetical protein